MQNFTRNIEDFVCEKCGAHIKGNGYTNHCPHCLYSKHVDKIPGDRAENCGGLMEPIGAELKNGAWVIIHRCQKCGFVRKNKVGPEDNFDKVVEASAKGGK
jgi:rubrerythrin